MKPFDVLNLGNISYFHLDHSNCYLFYRFNFLRYWQMSKINYLFGNISGLSEYFSKPIFALKPGVQADVLSTINPIIGSFFWT